MRVELAFGPFDARHDVLRGELDRGADLEHALPVPQRRVDQPFRARRRSRRRRRPRPRTGTCGWRGGRAAARRADRRRRASGCSRCPAVARARPGSSTPACCGSSAGGGGTRRPSGSDTSLVPYHEATRTVPSWASKPSAVRSASGLPDASITSGTVERPVRLSSEPSRRRVGRDRVDAEPGARRRAATPGARRRPPGRPPVGAAVPSATRRHRGRARRPSRRAAAPASKRDLQRGLDEREQRRLPWVDGRRGRRRRRPSRRTRPGAAGRRRPARPPEVGPALPRRRRRSCSRSGTDTGTCRRARRSSRRAASSGSSSPRYASISVPALIPENEVRTST